MILTSLWYPGEGAEGPMPSGLGFIWEKIVKSILQDGIFYF